MFPALPALYIGNGRSTDLICFCNFRLQPRVADYCNRLSLGQFSHTVGVATILSILLHLVAHVRGLIAQEQMIRVHALWIITAMQNMFFFGDCPAVYYPRNTVRARLKIPMRAASEDTIAASVSKSVGGPIPATCLNICGEAPFEFVDQRRQAWQFQRPSPSHSRIMNVAITARVMRVATMGCSTGYDRHKKGLLLQSLRRDHQKVEQNEKSLDLYCKLCGSSTKAQHFQAARL